MFRLDFISKHGEICKIFKKCFFLVFPDDKAILWTAIATARGQKLTFLSLTQKVLAVQTHTRLLFKAYEKSF